MIKINFFNYYIMYSNKTIIIHKTNKAFECIL